MTDSIFEDQISFEVFSRHADVEFYLFEDRTVKVRVSEGGFGDGGYASFNMTPEAATALKEFLIRKGY